MMFETTKYIHAEHFKNYFAYFGFDINFLHFLLKIIDNFKLLQKNVKFLAFMEDMRFPL